MADYYQTLQVVAYAGEELVTINKFDQYEVWIKSTAGKFKHRGETYHRVGVIHASQYLNRYARFSRWAI